MPLLLFSECALCALFSDLGIISWRDWQIFALHLKKDHGLKPFYIAP